MMPEEHTKIVYQTLAKAAEICSFHGVKYAVLSPGSRSAPIALSIIRNVDIKHFVIPDERSAAYIALGLAQSSKSPVVLVCTSGTAALNFAPAIAEAYFSDIPLIVLTADRPPEWIAQADNQSIFQSDLYRKHVKVSMQWPVDMDNKDSEWFALRSLNEAFNIAKSFPSGPVHINIPLREPLYLKNDEKVEINGDVPVFQNVITENKIPQSIFEELKNYNKILVFAGMQAPDNELKKVFDNLKNQFVFIPDIVSNLHDIENAVNFAELIVENIDAAQIKSLKPDLLITFGGPAVSKSLKNFFRNFINTPQWHINEWNTAPDTYQKLSKIIVSNPKEFFSQWQNIENRDHTYIENWRNFQIKIRKAFTEVIDNLEFGEVKTAIEIFKSTKGVLHVGNSLPIRYVAAFGLVNRDLEIFSNRGTSGIDGCLSTAVGHALANPQKNHTILLGDMSFMYDRNALWNSYLPSNLKIIVLNNHGGEIFRQLPGSSQQPEREEYFAVNQPLRFEHTAKQHNCQYFLFNENDDFKDFISKFNQSQTTAIFEMEFKSKQTIADVKQKIKIKVQ